MFQVAEIAVSRHMFREILMLIAQLRGRSLQYEGGSGRKAWTTMGEVRLDEGR